MTSKLPTKDLSGSILIETRSKGPSSAKEFPPIWDALQFRTDPTNSDPSFSLETPYQRTSSAGHEGKYRSNHRNLQKVRQTAKNKIRREPSRLLRTGELNTYRIIRFAHESRMHSLCAGPIESRTSGRLHERMNEIFSRLLRQKSDLSTRRLQAYSR